MVKKKNIQDEKVLDIDAAIQGTVVFKDPVNLRINGDFNGKLDTKGSLVIGEAARITADITGDHITIAGHVTGDVHARESLTVVAPAYLKGNVHTTSLSVSEGAVIDGMLVMSPGGIFPEQILGVAEVARYLEVDDAVLVEWAKNNKIPAALENNEWRFKKKDVDAWIQTERVKV